MTVAAPWVGGLIVVDTSAFVAMFKAEPDADTFAAAIARVDGLIVSALTLFETRTVLGAGKAKRTIAAFNAWFETSGAEIRPFDAAMGDLAFAAYSRYGKGVHPKARLNLYDCAAYALAKSLDAPLLFKGADFRHTDVTAAL
jgi:ribonuclease VapC